MRLMQLGRVGCTHQTGGSARLGEDSLVDPEHDARAQRLCRQAHSVRQLRRRPLPTRLNRQRKCKCKYTSYAGERYLALTESVHPLMWREACLV